MTSVTETPARFRLSGRGVSWKAETLRTSFGRADSDVLHLPRHVVRVGDGRAADGDERDDAGTKARKASKATPPATSVRLCSRMRRAGANRSIAPQGLDQTGPRRTPYDESPRTSSRRHPPGCGRRPPHLSRPTAPGKLLAAVPTARWGTKGMARGAGVRTTH